MLGKISVATITLAVVGFTVRPAHAQATCNSSSPCVYANNGGSGEGVEGLSQSSYGVYGQSTSNVGVYGYTTNGYPGVEGGNNSSTGGPGVYGWSYNSYAVWGKSTNSNAIVGEALNSGNGIYGSSTSGYAGYFAGNVYVSGTVTQNSDVRLKKDIKPLTGALDELLKLQGVTFEWKDPSEHGRQTGTQRGFIAQDVEKVFPNWVATDDKGYETLSVQQIEAMEVESIRTLKNQNDGLRAETDMLKQRVAALESGRQPRISAFGLNGFGFGAGGLAVVGAILIGTRRNRNQVGL